MRISPFPISISRPRRAPRSRGDPCSPDPSDGLTTGQPALVRVSEAGLARALPARPRPPNPAPAGAPCQAVGNPPVSDPGEPRLTPNGHITRYSPSIPSNSESTVQAWRQFLSRFPMQWFCTFTFTENVHPERAGKLFRLFIRRLNRHLYGSHCERRGIPGVFWVLASEYQRRGVLHFHALIGDVEDLNTRARRLDWMDRWHAFGPPAGFARIEAITSQDAVRSYTTKYVAKGGQIDLSASLRSFAQQQALSNPLQ